MVGKTEIITDNLNPVFVKSVLINYMFEERQDIKIVVYDIDNFKEDASVEQDRKASCRERVYVLV